MERGSHLLFRVIALFITCLLLCIAPSLTAARAIVGSHFVSRAKAAASEGDLSRAISLLRKAIQYRDTVARRKLISAYYEEKSAYAKALYHLKRAHELSPTLHIVRERVRLQSLVQEAKKAQLAAEERRERELARRQAERRRQALNLGTAASQEKGENRDADGAGGEFDLEALEIQREEGAAREPGADYEKIKEDLPKDLKSFWEGLSSVSGLARRRSALALANSGRKEVAPRIAALLKDEDPFVRMDAADALGQLASADTVIPLLEQLFVEQNDSVRSSIVAAIEAEGSMIALRGLSQYRDGLNERAKIYSHVCAAIDRLSRELE